MSFACPSVILYDFSFIQEMEDGFQDETILCILVLIVFSRGCPVRQILDMMVTTNEFLSQKTCVVIMITTVMRAKDLHNVYSCNIKFVPWNEIVGVAHHYEIILEWRETIQWGLAQLICANKETTGSACTKLESESVRAVA